MCGGARAYRPPTHQADMGAATLESRLVEAQRTVDAAYALHDASLGDPKERTARMRHACADALAAVAQCEAAEGEAGSALDRRSLQARLMYLRGKAAACTEEGRLADTTERALADAVKMDPTIIDAWNCLGECFWQRGELETARHVFLGALEHERTSTTLCHLSMLLRSMSGAMGREESLLVESVTLAKEAARIDPTCATVWSGLGAAHLSVHLNVTGAAEDLHFANRAFTQASRVLAPEENADVYANHGMVCMLLDLYDASLRHFSRAHDLDAALGADHKRQAAWQSVVHITDAIAAKRQAIRGEGRQKRLVQMIADLATAAPPGAGPTTLLSQLTPGDNAGRVVMLKVISALPQTGIRHASETQTLIVADQNADLMALTAYALRGVPPLEPGTTLELREPQLLRVEVSKTWEGASPDHGAITGFHLLRIESPSAQMRINGHPVHAVRGGPRRR